MCAGFARTASLVLFSACVSQRAGPIRFAETSDSIRAWTAERIVDTVASSAGDFGLAITEMLSMRKAAVRHGDPTTTRGFVIALSSTIHDNGKKVALSGDDATCGNCKGVWKIYGTGKGMFGKGRCVVVDGDLVLCPCKKNRVIVGSNPGIFLECDEGLGATEVRGSAGSVTPVDTSASAVDQHFRIVNSDGTPVVGLPYRLEASGGQIVKGLTSAEGLTQRISANGTNRVRLLLHVSQ